MSPPRVTAYQHGIYPRSEEVVQATRDLERRRATSRKVDAALAAAREALAALQREARLDLLSDGLLRWQDLFRPLVEATEGMDARVLVRWFDNNSFFRAPEAPGHIRFGEPPRWFLEDGIPEPRVASLPSPYLFSRAAQTGGDRDALMRRLAREVLAPAAAALVAGGHALVHLEEPWLAYFGIEDEAWVPLERSLATIRDAVGEATLVLHTYFGDAAPHAERLRHLPVDAVGIDFVETDLDALSAPWGTGLVAGVIDGRRSVVEPATEVAAFVEAVADRLEPTALFVTSASDLELCGPEVAPAKVRALGEAAARVREVLR